MAPFNQINTIPELKSALEQLAIANKTLLSENPENYMTNFAELLTSPLFAQNSEIKPVKIFEAIVEAGMEFNISEHPLLLDDLFNNNTSLNVQTDNGISKKHYDATKILAKKFGLTGDIAITSQEKTITELLLDKSSPAKTLETLEILLNTNLLPTVENMGGNLPLAANIANSLANKINNMDLLSKIINKLQSKYDLHEFTGKLLQATNSDNIADILNTFNEKAIKLNLNQQLANGQKLFEIIAYKYSLNPLSYDKLLQSMTKHDIDFSDVITTGKNPFNYGGHNFISAVIQHAIEFHFTPDSLLSIVSTTATYDKSGFTTKIEVNGVQTSALKMISAALQNSQKINKEFVKVLAQANVSFADVFGAFKDIVGIDKIIKPFAKKLDGIDFNSLSQELAMNMMPHVPVGMANNSYGSTSLLKEIFGYVTNKKQFEKVIKLLSENYNIDWGQPLNGVGGNSIFEKISHFYGIDPRNYIEILDTAKEHGLKTPLNSVNSLKFITDNISIPTDIKELLSKIKDLDLEVDKGMMAISLAVSKGVPLLEASVIIGIEEKLEHKLDILGLSNIPNILNINGNAWSLKANIINLQGIYFEQWNDDFGNGNNFLHATLRKCDILNNAKVLLREAAGLKLDINAENNQGETPLDILFRSHQFMHSYERVELFGILKLFENTDWTKVVDAINTPLDQQIINSLLENLPKNIDVTKPVNGKSLLNNLISKINNLGDLEYLLKTFGDKFELELQNHVNSIIEALPSNLLNFNYLEQLLNKVNLQIDWRATEEGNVLFAKLLQTVNTVLLKENVEYLLTKLGNDFNWNQPLDSKGNNLLLLLAQHNENNCWQLIQDLVTKLDEQGLPIFNINYLNNENARIIELLVKFYQNGFDYLSHYITMLRENGSVEPKNLISTTIPKLDVNRDGFDSYFPNQQATPKILQELYKVVTSNFPHGLTPEKIDELINNFKNRDYTDYPPNIDWENGKQFTIPEVVDKLVLLGAVKDRLADNWDFKKVLAAIIYISDENENTKLLLCNTLVVLKMCNLGKLMNLLNVVQATLSDNIDYSAIPFGKYADMFNSSLIKIKEHFGKEQANKAVKEWVYELASKVDAAQWSPMTTMVHSIITKEFIAFVKPNFDSYHFTTGLKGNAIAKLIDSITGNHPDENLSPWYDAIQYAQEEVIQSLIEKLRNKEDVGAILSESSYQSEMCFNDFRYVSKGFLQKKFNELYKNDKTSALEFLIVLQKNLVLSTEVSGFIAEELSNAVIQEYFDKNEYIELFKENILKIELVDNNTVLSLLGKIPDLHDLLIKNTKINWLKKGNDEKTLLSEIAKFLPEDAKELYQSHETEWGNIINHEISMNGEVGDHFGDLI